MSGGDYNCICDLCGRKRKASECRLKWNNFFVCADTCWEPRHPQDFVEGRADDQNVPIARPDVAASMGLTTLWQSASKNATLAYLTSVVGLNTGDSLGIILDDGTCHWTYMVGIPVPTIIPAGGWIVTLGSYLPGAASSGNVVYIPSINNETFITATSITADDL